MASLIEAIDIKRKMFFEFEDAPYHCLDVEVSKPTARGGQTLVRIKMRNLLTRAVFDKTFKAGEKFKEPDLVMVAGDVPLFRRPGLQLHGPGDLRDADAGRGHGRRRRGAARGQRDRPDPEVQRQSDRAAVPAARGARRSPTPSRARGATRPAAASPRRRRSRPASRSACRCSSRKARRSRSTPRRASSPGAHRTALTARSRRRYKTIASGRS